MGEPIHRGLDACEVRPPVILKEKECKSAENKQRKAERILCA
jgi:hypothetical protein